MHFNLSMALYVNGGAGGGMWGEKEPVGREREREKEGERERCTSSNPVSASLMRLLTINHAIGYAEMQHPQARA